MKTGSVRGLALVYGVPPALGRRLARGGGRGGIKDPGLMLPLLVVVSVLRHDVADLLVAGRHAIGS